MVTEFEAPRPFASPNPAAVCFLFDTVFFRIRLGDSTAWCAQIPPEILRKSSTDKKRAAADVSRLLRVPQPVLHSGIANRSRSRFARILPLQSSYGFSAPFLPDAISS
jgi:hypothetical protein